MTIYFLLQFTLVTFLRYWNGPAYGARAYISSLPFFAILFAHFVNIIRRKFSFKSAFTVISLLAVINIVSISSFILFEKDVNSGLKRGLEEKTQIKVNGMVEQVIKYLHKK
jgi:hypothetical protein